MKLSYNQKEELKLLAYYVGGFILCCVLGYYSWHFGRQLNYNWSYKDMVTETICKTVKHEHLVNPRMCEK